LAEYDDVIRGPLFSLTSRNPNPKSTADYYMPCRYQQSLSRCIASKKAEFYAAKRLLPELEVNL